jgi:hypothetical protein
VASFIVKELMKRRKISEKTVTVPSGSDLASRNEINEASEVVPIAKEQGVSDDQKREFKKRRRSRGGRRRFKSKSGQKSGLTGQSGGG